MTSTALHPLRQAIELATHSVEHGGGPFGAIVVRGGVVVGDGHNRVTLDRDPTAHAEIVAIRAACTRLDTHSLHGCVLYASCEPCPMCLAAAYWARIDRIEYAATRAQAAEAGFDDAFLYEELGRAQEARSLPVTRHELPEAQEPFARWSVFARRIPY